MDLKQTPRFFQRLSTPWWPTKNADLTIIENLRMLHKYKIR
jgi:hypothetical protein